MQVAHRILLAAGLAAASASSLAATSVYTSSASFMANVAPGAYTNGFDNLTDPPAGPYVLTGNGFSYSVSAPSSIYLGGNALSTSLPNQPLTFTFTSGNVTALGGNFYPTNFSDEFVSVSVQVALNDGTTVNFTPATIGDSYRGFVSNVAVTSLTVSGPGTSLYASVDNFTVGVSVVPEPGSWALMAIGVAGLLAVRRRAAA